MKNIFLFLYFVTISIYGQIDCNPLKGQNLKPISKGANLRENPNLNSAVIIKTPNPDEIWLECMEDGFSNEFVKVKIEFLTEVFNEKGVNSNLLVLYNNLKYSHNYDFTFRDFFEQTSNIETINEWYRVLIEDKEDFNIKNWDSSEDYDVSTIEGFIKYWIYFDKNKSDYKYILDNHERIVYIHKSQLTNSIPTILSLPEDSSAEEYLTEVEKYIEFKETRNCLYTENLLYQYFSRYIKSLANENPFLAIQEIQKYSINFETDNSNYKLKYLKMYCSYLDKNYTTTSLIGKELIMAYKNKLIKNTSESFEGDIDMADVYAYLISSLINNSKSSEALTFSKECLANNRLQHEKYLELHAIILLNLNKKSEACKILNAEYLNGNENARELINEYCK